MMLEDCPDACLDARLPTAVSSLLSIKRTRYKIFPTTDCTFIDGGGHLEMFSFWENDVWHRRGCSAVSECRISEFVFR